MEREEKRAAADGQGGSEVNIDKAKTEVCVWRVSTNG